MKSILSIICVVFIFSFKSYPADEESQGNGELIFVVANLQEYQISLRKVLDTIAWGKSTDGFPITTSYDGPYQLTGYGMTADHVDDINTNQIVVAYGLYELAIIVNGVGHSIKLDYRDADFGINRSLYINRDLDIDYNPSTNIWMAEGNVVQENSVVPHWLSANKPTGTNNLNPFTPTNPIDLSITNYYNHPQLNWTASDPVSGAKYKIYRNNTLVYTTSIGATEWIDEYIVIGGGANYSYTYKVQGLSGDETKTSSGYTNEVTVTGIRYEKQQQTITGGAPRWSSKIEEIYPNPFNPETKIRFTVGEDRNVNIKVFDATGREVRVLLNEEKQEGSYEISFNASHLSSGIYYCRLTSGSHMDTKKLVLQK